MRLFKLLSLSTAAFFLLGTAWADQVALKNGDRVTGSIVKKDEKNLTIKTDHFGVVTIAWDQVESVKADKPVNVVLQGGKAVKGTLTTTDGKVQVATEGTTISLPAAEIAAIRNEDEQKTYERLLSPGLRDLWAGTASLGFAGASGNARTLVFTTGVNAARVTRTDKTSLYFSAIKASALVDRQNVATAKAVRGGLAYDHNISPRLFVNIFNDYEYDQFQNLDLRFVLGGGLGFHAVKTERTFFDVLAGADYNHSKFSTPLTRNSAELYWGDEFGYKLSGATSLVQSFRMFNDLSETGRYRVNFDIGASTKLAKWLNWNVSVSDRYLSSPAPGRKTNDFLYTTGIGVNFAR